MDEGEIKAWRDIIITNTVTAIALIKVLNQKGIVSDEEMLAAIAETKAELTKKQTG